MDDKLDEALFDAVNAHQRLYATEENLKQRQMEFDVAKQFLELAKQDYESAKEGKVSQMKHLQKMFNFKAFL